MENENKIKYHECPCCGVMTENDHKYCVDCEELKHFENGEHQD